MNAPHTFPRPTSADVIASLRSSAITAERVGQMKRAAEYRRWADTSEIFDAAILYQHFANEAAEWAAKQEDRA